MRAQKILKRTAIILLIICIIFIAIDLFKMLKINIDFMGMQASERISSSSNEATVRYAPSDYKILNKDDALAKIKSITVSLKEEYEELEEKEDLFEIGNIHKIENFFYEYQAYAVVKYKLLNIIEDLPKLSSKINGYDENRLNTYYDQNSSHLEEYYGITNNVEFIKFAKSLDFLKNSEIKRVVLDSYSIDFDYDNDTLDFKIKIRAGNDNIATYLIETEYYKHSNNQVKPYVRVSFFK